MDFADIDVDTAAAATSNFATPVEHISRQGMCVYINNHSIAITLQTMVTKSMLAIKQKSKIYMYCSYI